MVDDEHHQERHHEQHALHDHHDVRPRPFIFHKDHRDRIAAITSGIVAAIALATSTYNVYLQRQQVRAQVWPKVVLASSWEKGGKLALSLSNRGVGPAEVRRFRASFDGAPVHNWPDLLRKILGTEDVPLEGFENVDPTITAGQDQRILTFYDKPTGIKYAEASRRVRYEVCYCSVLEECWNVVIFGDDPDVKTPVEGCARDSVPFIPVAKEDIDRTFDQARQPGRVGDGSVAGTSGTGR